MDVPENQPNGSALDDTARSGAERDWPIVQRGVMIAGENPMIVLYRPGSDDLVAIASVWTASYSPAGEGRALVIWADPDATGLGDLSPVGIFTDNADLARYVWANFYNDYEPIKGRGIEETPVRPARFTELSDGQRLHHISCTVGSTTIELEWRDVIEVSQVVTYPTGYEVSVIAAPCAKATITVDGIQATGEIHQPEGWFGSSAILAFAETWIAIEG
ncbi:MAG TPA: hypothetical protein VD767_02935 [Thermomicrobiales bacterium]|nr:hypothetical protein [Thermomicrobiales bacterium]